MTTTTTSPPTTTTTTSKGHSALVTPYTTSEFQAMVEAARAHHFAMHDQLVVVSSELYRGLCKAQGVRGLMGLDVRIAARKVTRNVTHAAGLNVEAAKAMVRAYTQFTQLFVELDDLIGLQEDGFIRATAADEEVASLASLAMDGRVLELLKQYDIRIAITPAGVDWVTGNPCNRALCTVTELDQGRGALLKEAAAKADVRESAYLIMVSAGWAVIRTPDGHEVGPNDTLMLRVVGLRVWLTIKGRRLVGEVH